MPGISDIKTDEQLVASLDSYLYRLKTCTTPLGIRLREVLNEFVKDNYLNSDPHAFASLPEAVPEEK